ncbi:MAG: CoA transferase [Acidimicrobiaceae bacterium]|nr:CoA transferase [Acidimicrobiaceae bacterium]
MTVRESGPLADVHVVELAAYMSAPFAAMMLADLGASVTKVESPKGDPYRRFRGARTAMSPQFANINRNKTSVIADLKDLAGQARVRELLRDADVLLTNLRPATARRLGLDDEALAAANPKLIRCWVTGFGTDGPDADRPAYDPIIQAQAGMTQTWGDSDHPAIAPNFLADGIAASMNVQAILAALYARQRTGLGERIDAAMLDAVSYFSFPTAMAHRTLLDHQPPGPDNPDKAPIRPIAASDGWLIVGPVTRDQIRGSCAAVGHPEWAEELMAAHPMSQLSYPLLDRLETVTRTAPTSQWLEAFAKHDVPAARCLSAEEHFEDPQVRYNELYSIEPWPDLGPVRQARYPARYGSWPHLGVRRPAPAVGES